MNHEHGAVLIFKVPKNLLSQGLNITEKEHTSWSTIVAYYRSGCRNPKLENLDNFPYIYGPISKPNKISSAKQYSSPSHRLDNKGNCTFQMCLKDKETAKKFYNKGKHIEKLIVLSNHYIL